MNGRMKAFLALTGLLLLALVAGGVSLFAGLPDLQTLPERLNTPSLRITDRNGRLLYEALPEHGGRHSALPLEMIPLDLRQATVATEDSRFYQNPGVDPLAIMRALWDDLRSGAAYSGGSTLTQQVARNLLLESDERYEHSLRRKLREAVLAWQLAQRYSKDDILALYLNQTYYGGMAYGVEAAAQTYFGKPAAELDLAECALIAGLPQAPALYDPFNDLEAAKTRQQVVLGRMQAEGYITPEQQKLAEREPLVFNPEPYPILAPHFVMLVRAQIDGLGLKEQLLRRGGLVVRTTLDLDWQMQAEGAVARQLKALRHSDDGLGHNVNNAALVAIDPQRGDVLAMVGSPDFFDAEHQGAINMALAPRQPGSALKPLVYAAAFDPKSSQPWTAATMLLDVRTAFTTHDGLVYIPKNYDRQEHGPVLTRTALASSLNIPAVLTLQHVGLENLFRLTSAAGLSTLGNPDDYDLSLALGGGAVRLLDLTAAYGMFANGGYRLMPRTILEVSDPAGETLYSAPPVVQQRLIDARVAWLISDILSDPQARRIGFGPNSLLRLDRPAAVKTGTTSNFHDNWTVGYTPDLVVGVWAGNSDYRPMRDVDGLSGAAPIWHQFIRTALTGQPERDFVRPDGLVQMEVCALSGLLPTADCPYQVQEWFINGTQPTQSDTFYQKVWIDRNSGRLATPHTPAERRISRLALDLPPQAHAWARTQGFLLLDDLSVGLQMGSDPSTQGDPQVSGSAASAALHMISPAAGSLYRLSPTFVRSAQRLRLEAAGAGLQQVTLWLDGEPLQRFTQPPYAAWWALAPGTHQVWAEGLDAQGRPVSSVRISFEVQAAEP